MSSYGSAAVLAPLLARLALQRPNSFTLCKEKLCSAFFFYSFDGPTKASRLIQTPTPAISVPFIQLICTFLEARLLRPHAS